MEELENKEFCSKCGGYCCKKCGCDYFVEDFEDLSMKGILELLATGNISIVALINFEKLPNGKVFANPFLYLRARNVDRDVVDLLSIKKSCSMLENDQCHYTITDRPSGGVNLIPASDRSKCHHKEDPYKKVMQWERYQKVLSKIVKRYTGKTVDEKLKEDAENILYDILSENFKNVAIEEVVDVKGMMPLLIQAFPKEAANALIRHEKDTMLLVK